MSTTAARTAPPWEVLGDFTTTRRLLPISALAIGIGVVAAFVALALLRLIGLFTNLFYFGRWSTALVSPVGNHLGTWADAVQPSLLADPFVYPMKPQMGEAGTPFKCPHCGKTSTYQLFDLRYRKD